MTNPISTRRGMGPSTLALIAIAAAILLATVGCSGGSDSDSLAMRLSSYIGQPVDSLLQQVDSTGYQSYRFIDGPTAVLQRCEFTFADGFRVHVDVTAFRIDGLIDTTRTWDIETFRSQSVRAVRLLP